MQETWEVRETLPPHRQLLQSVFLPQVLYLLFAFSQEVKEKKRKEKKTTLRSERENGSAFLQLAFLQAVCKLMERAKVRNGVKRRKRCTLSSLRSNESAAHSIHCPVLLNGQSRFPTLQSNSSGHCFEQHYFKGQRQSETLTQLVAARRQFWPQNLPVTFGLGCAPSRAIATFTHELTQTPGPPPPPTCPQPLLSFVFQSVQAAVGVICVSQREAGGAVQGASHSDTHLTPRRSLTPPCEGICLQRRRPWTAG